MDDNNAIADHWGKGDVYALIMAALEMDSNGRVANETQRNISRAMPETRTATISDSVARPRISREPLRAS